MFGMQLCRFAGVMGCVLCVALRSVRMMCSGLMVAGFVVFPSFAMMACCVFVMFCCLRVMVRCFLRHIESPWNTSNWPSRPKLRMNCERNAGYRLFY
jgi:hypothetical protein